jgi:hypothetical protein
MVAEWAWESGWVLHRAARVSATQQVGLPEVERAGQVGEAVEGFSSVSSVKETTPALITLHDTLEAVIPPFTSFSHRRRIVSV